MARVSARPETPSLRISFDERVGVRTRDLTDVLGKVLELTGCPMCGLTGIDLVLRRRPLVNPEGEAFVAVLEGIVE